MVSSRVVLTALGLWLVAIVGAAGVAYWLALPTHEAWLVIGVATIVALFGTVIPYLRINLKSNTRNQK